MNANMGIVDLHYFHEAWKTEIQQTQTKVQRKTLHDESEKRKKKEEKKRTRFPPQSFSYPETEYDEFLEYSAAHNGALEEEDTMTLVNTTQPPVHNLILSE